MLKNGLTDKKSKQLDGSKKSKETKTEGEQGNSRAMVPLSANGGKKSCIEDRISTTVKPPLGNGGKRNRITTNLANWPFFSNMIKNRGKFICSNCKGVHATEKELRYHQRSCHGNNPVIDKKRTRTTSKQFNPENVLDEKSAEETHVSKKRKSNDSNVHPTKSIVVGNSAIAHDDKEDIKDIRKFNNEEREFKVLVNHH